MPSVGPFLITKLFDNTKNILHICDDRRQNGYRIRLQIWTLIYVVPYEKVQMKTFNKENRISVWIEYIHICWMAKLNLILVVLYWALPCQRICIRKSWQFSKRDSLFASIHTHRHKNLSHIFSETKAPKSVLWIVYGILDQQSCSACCAFFNCEYRILSSKSEIIPV